MTDEYRVKENNVGIEFQKSDEEKAEDYVIETVCGYCNRCETKGYVGCDTYRLSKKAYLDGLAEDRKEKWHDLRKNPNDLPKCTENEQVIFYVREYYKAIEKYKNHYCLGVYKKSFMNDDVKLFVERSKGYECEHSTENVLYWCELPKFEE